MSEDKSETLKTCDCGAAGVLYLGHYRYCAIYEPPVIVAPLPSSEGTVKSKLGRVPLKSETAPTLEQSTRFAEFDDDSHPLRKWWIEHGQYMLSGGGRRESIWAARGWIAREQLICNVEVTGDSMHENSPSEQLVIDLARELYDRFVMGGWQPQDAHQMIREMLAIPSETVPTEAAKPQLPEDQCYTCGHMRKNHTLGGCAICLLEPQHDFVEQITPMNSESETVEEQAQNTQDLKSKAEQCMAANIAPGLMASISHELPDDIRVYRRSTVILWMVEFASSLLQEKQLEAEKLSGK